MTPEIVADACNSFLKGSVDSFIKVFEIIAPKMIPSNGVQSDYDGFEELFLQRTVQGRSRWDYYDVILELKYVPVGWIGKRSHSKLSKMKKNDLWNLMVPLAAFKREDEEEEEEPARKKPKKESLEGETLEDSLSLRELEVKAAKHALYYADRAKGSCTAICGSFKPLIVTFISVGWSRALCRAWTVPEVQRLP